MRGPYELVSIWWEKSGKLEDPSSESHDWYMRGPYEAVSIWWAGNMDPANMRGPYWICKHVWYMRGPYELVSMECGNLEDPASKRESDWKLFSCLLSWGPWRFVMECDFGLIGWLDCGLVVCLLLLLLVGGARLFLVRETPARLQIWEDPTEFVNMSDIWEDPTS
jgi:hypothetical protein